MGRAVSTIRILRTDARGKCTERTEPLRSVSQRKINGVWLRSGEPVRRRGQSERVNFEDLAAIERGELRGRSGTQTPAAQKRMAAPTFRIPRELLARFRAACAKRGASQSAVATVAIEAAIEVLEA